MSSAFDTFTKSALELQAQSEIEYIRNRVMCKFPLLGPTVEKLQLKCDSAVGTAATDGQAIYYNPEWFMNLTDQEKICVYAHEVLHVKFNHISRCLCRDSQLWNIATDAVINQMLKSENLAMPAGGVDIADAIQYSAEEMYEKLQERKQQQQHGGDNLNDILNQAPQNHNKWEDAAKQAAREQESSGDQSLPDYDAAQSKQPSPDAKPDENINQSKMEKDFCSENKQARDELAARARRQILRAAQNAGSGIGNLDRTMGEIGKSDAAVNWKRVLMKSVEKENDQWSYRRSDADNDFMARVEEMEDEDQSETEVILDVSGSVSDDFLREFLRQLKPLLKNSKLKVGFFDTSFYPFVEIKKDKDIDRLRIPGGGGTDMDVAVRNFSKKADVNKIVFTDGYGETRDRSLEKTKNLIWLVYDNKSFKPLCGRVIPVDSNTIRHNFISAPHMAPTPKSR